MGGDVNANLMDATYIVSAANWVLAELYRLAQGVSPKEPIRVIQRIVTPKIPLIYEIGDIKRVLNPRLSYKEKILLILYATFPEFRRVQDILRDTEYSNPSKFRKGILLTFAHIGISDNWLPFKKCCFAMFSNMSVNIT